MMRMMLKSEFSKHFEISHNFLFTTLHMFSILGHREGSLQTQCQMTHSRVLSCAASDYSACKTHVLVILSTVII